FFQAEDGIRDFPVTGVQTCALPISGVLVETDRGEPRQSLCLATLIDNAQRPVPGTGELARPLDQNVDEVLQIMVGAQLRDRLEQIGRASCRERVSRARIVGACGTER